MNHHGIKVGVQIRSNYATKPGGDIALAKAFAQRLREKGFQVEFVSSVETLRAYHPGLFIAFNLDQPLELLRLSREAKILGARVAVYALHHPSEGVRAYLRSGLAGTRGWVAKVAGADPAKYFHLMAILRNCFQLNSDAFKYVLGGYERLIEDVIPLIDDLLVSGESELAEIQKEMPALGQRTTVYIVPHPIDLAGINVPLDSPYSHDSQNRKQFFIAGRIESRKNQNVILNVASQISQADFIFAGQLNEADPKYCAEFRRLLNNNPNCRWVGQLNMTSLLQHIAHADAIVSPSWFEVMSLISLYAYALGTTVISTSHTYDNDVIQDRVIRFDPGNQEQLVQQLIAFLEAPVSVKPLSDVEARKAKISELTWAGFDYFIDETNKLLMRPA